MDGMFEAFEAFANEVERFFTDVAKDFNEMMDAIVEVSEELVDQMNDATVEFEQQMTDFIDPILEAYLGFEVTLEERTRPLMHTVDPVLNNHPACVGCRNYHGQMYGGNVLVCGMHPYGWEGEKCPDWESTWKS